MNETQHTFFNSVLKLAVLALLCFFMAVAVSHSHHSDELHLLPGEDTHKTYSTESADELSDDVEVVKPWKVIVQDKNYNGAWLVAGDVDGDGEADIVSCRSLMEGGSHYTASAIVHRLDGSVLWKWGKPEGMRDSLGSDFACQIYDWNGDGVQEVVLSTKSAGKTWLVELDGPTGKEKRRFEIPHDAADCIVFCNLSGNARATDLLVKTRYEQIWAFNYAGKQLWHSNMPGGLRTAHQPVPIDMDGDGKDEIQAGFAMLNSDGSVRWVLDRSDPIFARGKSLEDAHLDCARVFKLAEKPEDTRLVLTFCQGERIAMVDGLGKILWDIPFHHFESVDIGKVVADAPGKQIVVDIPYAPPGQQPVWIIDEWGKQLGEVLNEGSRFHRLIDWTDNGTESILIAEPPALYDGTTGEKIAVFEMPLPEGEEFPAVSRGTEKFICWVGDMTGDGRQDIIFGTNNPGGLIYIYKNQHGKMPKVKHALGTGTNVTLY
ncbi:MAG: hypothetical protein ACR2NM_00570 [Bythopirellula sp.]